MLGEIGVGLRPNVASAPQVSSRLAWPGLTMGSAATAGAMLGRGEVAVALLPIAVLLVFFFAAVPAAGYIAVLWSVGTAVDMLAPPQLGISSLQFLPAEILLWIALGCLMFVPRDVRHELRGLVRQRESVVMAIFLTAVIGGVAVGVAHGASLHIAAFDMRSMLFYAAFWLAAAALTRNRGAVFKLVSAGVVVVVVLQTVQVIVGPSTHVFVIAPSDVASSLTPGEGGFLRVRPPGGTTVYVVAAFALARLLWGPARHRLLGWGMTVVALTGVILSLNRNMLLGLALGLCVAAVVARQKHRFVVMVATLGMVLSAFASLGPSSSAASNPVVSRITSITNYSGLKTQTLDDRFYENRNALHQIRAHPIEGLGWGPNYGAMLLSSDDGFLVSNPRPFMHQQYLWVWMRAGAIGLLALIASLAFGIWNGARWCRARHGSEDAWLGAAIVVSVVAMAASSNVAIYLTRPDSTVPLAGVLALAAVLRRELG
jgi:hypothetical protein